MCSSYREAVLPVLCGGCESCVYNNDHSLFKEEIYGLQNFMSYK